VKRLNGRTGKTARMSRNKAKKKVVQQFETYGEEWAHKHPQRKVEACFYFGGREKLDFRIIQEESPEWQDDDPDESPATRGLGSQVRQEKEPPATSGGWGLLCIGIGLLFAAGAALTYALAADANQQNEERREN